MAGTVTGKNAKIYITVHGAGVAPTFSYTHTTWGLGDFSLTLDRGTVEQDLVGEEGSYFDQGGLSVDGSLTACKFATQGISHMLNNIVEAGAGFQYLAISGTVSTETDVNYLSWYLRSCQVTGYDVSIGDADTITEASIDFTLLDPQNLTYSNRCIKDG